MQEPAYIVIEADSHEKWLKNRTYGIGGSDASAVVGLNPYKTNIQLFEEKTGKRIPEDISEKPYVKYGTLAEPLIRDLFRLDYPEYQVEHHENRILRSTKFPFMQASLDGELTDQNGRRPYHTNQRLGCSPNPSNAVPLQSRQKDLGSHLRDGYRGAL